MTKLGAHVALTERDGYSAFCSAKPRVVFSVDQGGALLEARDLSQGHAVTIFRTQEVFDDAPGDLEIVSAPMRDVAKYWYREASPNLKQVWEMNPANFYAITNEIGGDNPESIRRVVEFEREVTILANADGFKTCILNLATGSPGDFHLWKDLIAPFIIEAWIEGNIYGRHVYNIDEPNLINQSTGLPYEGNPARPFEEVAFLNSLGHHGGVALTEVGLDGGFMYAGITRFFDQMTRFEKYCGAYGDIIGVCMWTLGKWHTANWQSAIPTLVPYMIQNPMSPWRPNEEVSPKPPTRVPNLVRHAIHLLPQAASLDQRRAVVERLAEFNTSFTHSHDVVEAVMFHSKEGGEIVVWDAWKWDFNVRAYFSWLDMKYTERSFAELGVGDDTPEPPKLLRMDMAKFFFPPNGQEFGDIVILKNSWGEGDERQQLQRDGDISYVTKNNLFEQRVVYPADIELRWDNSRGDGEAYTVRGSWLPRLMSVGETFTRTEEVTVYDSDCVVLSEYTSESDIVFAQYYPTLTIEGTEVKGVARLLWIVDGVVDEEYFYAEELGLVQWRKKDGRTSWVHEIIPLGDQHNNSRWGTVCL